MPNTLHQAHAVRYPFEVSRRIGIVLGAMAAVACGVLLTWWAQQRWQMWYVVGGSGLWLACTAVAWQGWRSHGIGDLYWDGQQWWLSDARREAQLLRGVQLVLDVQFGLCLFLQPVAGRARWVWLERGVDAARWLDLRRAVVAHGRATVNRSTTLERRA